MKFRLHQVLNGASCVGALSAAFSLGLAQPAMANSAMPGSASVSALLAGASVGQSTVAGSTIQSQILEAIANGQSVLTLPPNKILLTTSLVIPANAQKFSLVGQAGTEFQRTGTVDFPLLLIGRGYQYAWNNAAFSAQPQMSVAPVAEGAMWITRTGGAEARPGWHALLGVHPTNDIVVHTNGVTRFDYKRELVRVTRVEGDRMYVAEPIAREFATPEMRFMDDDQTHEWYATVPENITVRNIKFTGRSATNNAWSNKLIAATAAVNLRLENLELSGFNNAAISVMFSKGVYITNIRTSDGNTSNLGYGVEFAASRNVTLRNAEFSGHRWGTIFQSGTTDALVEDCRYAPGATGGFDGGHGLDERRITFRRCIGPSWSIANPGYLRGVKDVTLEDCTAYGTINVSANAENVRIKGKYPGQPNTMRMLQLSTEGGTNSVPAGSFPPKSVYLQNGSSVGTDLDGVTIQMHSITGQPLGIGLLDVQDWSFRNLVSATGAAVKFTSTATQSNLRFTNVTFQNTYLYNSPLWMGPVSGTGAWNITLQNCQLDTRWRYGVNFANNSRGTVTANQTYINGSLFNSSHVNNLATGAMP